MRGRALQINSELKQTRSMRGRSHAKTLRIQRNNINVKARAFNLAANSRKQSQCAGARIQRNRERKQTMSMRGRAHSKTLRIQRNKINVKACAFKQSTNSRKHDQCVGAHLTKPRTQANKVNAPARALNKTLSSSK